MEWNDIQNLLSNIVFALLLVTMIFYWISIILFKNPMLLKIGRAGAFIANVLLFFILSSRWIVAGYFPLSNLYESLLFLTWALLATYLYVEHKTKSKLIGATLIPVALLVSGFANLTLPPEMQKASPLVPALQSNWLMMHVSMMMLSYSTLIVGSLLSILFLIISKGQEIEYIDTFSNSYSTDVEKNTLTEIGSTISLNTIKDSKLKLLFNIDNWSYRVIGLGFPFLTIGIIAGGVWANEAWGSYWSWDPKETWALITWLVFAAYLHARITKNWQGKRTAILGSLGFFVIWICYLGVNFLGKGLHSYGWLS
jgi:cytochrome c-type biogenesis protein CcsB|tara:strand:+ start:1596 stop:2528 length:933 start_codon:yes stop_codon:yes gene_type:complete